MSPDPTLRPGDAGPRPPAGAAGGATCAWPPLDLLGGVLPGPDQTLFLLACLAPPPRAVKAWERWRARYAPAEGLARGNEGLRGLSALLASSLLDAGAALDRHDAAWLRAALVHEEQRTGRYRAILAEVLGALAAAGVPFLLSRGTAVAETVLPRPWLRHCHDVDLLVTPGDLDAAAQALRSAGLDERPAASGTRSFLHARRLPVLLHTRPIAAPLGGPAVAELAVRSERLPVLGVTVRVPAADDLLIQVCGHAVASASRTTARWVCDAHEIVVRRPGLDWSRLRATAAAEGLAAPLAATLGYLADAIGTPVPAATHEALERDALRATRFERDLLVHAARGGGTRSFGSLWASAGARSRVTLLRWVLAPAQDYLRRLDGGSGLPAPALLARHYLHGWRRFRAARASARQE